MPKLFKLGNPSKGYLFVSSPKRSEHKVFIVYKVTYASWLLFVNMTPNMVTLGWIMKHTETWNPDKNKSAKMAGKFLSSCASCSLDVSHSCRGFGCGGDVLSSLKRTSWRRIFPTTSRDTRRSQTQKQVHSHAHSCSHLSVREEKATMRRIKSILLQR